MGYDKWKKLHKDFLNNKSKLVNNVKFACFVWFRDAKWLPEEGHYDIKGKQRTDKMINLTQVYLKFLSI